MGIIPVGYCLSQFRVAISYTGYFSPRFETVAAGFVDVEDGRLCN